MTIRVLALCGFAQNAFVYSQQLAPIQRTCTDVEFVFLEPPFPLEIPDTSRHDHLSHLSDLSDDSGPETTMEGVTMSEDIGSPETTPRAWAMPRDDGRVYVGLDEAYRYIHDFMVERGPFDGIMGFSQGACMAAIIAALLENPSLNHAWPSHPPLPRLQFLICVGGFLPTSTTPSFAGYFPLPAHLPVLHVMGRNDTHMVPERSDLLVRQCLSSRVEMHHGGHYTPTKANWRRFFSAYIMSFAPGGSRGQVGSPSSFGPSAIHSYGAMHSAVLPVGERVLPAAPAAPAIQA